MRHDFGTREGRQPPPSRVHKSYWVYRQAVSQRSDNSDLTRASQGWGIGAGGPDGTPADDPFDCRNLPADIDL